MRKLLLAVLGVAALCGVAYAQNIPDLVYRVSDQVTAPKILVPAKPLYTPAAMLRRVQGVVELEVDVMADGTVGTVALVKSLDPELDKEAVAAARKYRFTPGTRDGKPVAVRTTVTLEYHMR